jgi:hypothetical protein
VVNNGSSRLSTVYFMWLTDNMDPVMMFKTSLGRNNLNSAQIKRVIGRFAQLKLILLPFNLNSGLFAPLNLKDKHNKGIKKRLRKAA